MAVIDIPARRIDARVVFYGPGGGGKTTTLRWIAAAVPDRARGRFVAMTGDDGRTLVLDGLPLDLGVVGGWRIRLDLVGVPGQPAYAQTRLALMTGADGVVFVADSDPARRAANRDSFAELERTLAGAGHRPGGLPLVVQANKRDLTGAIPIADLLSDLGSPDAEAIAAVATSGSGVVDVLRSVCRRVARSL